MHYLSFTFYLLQMADESRVELPFPFPVPLPSSSSQHTPTEEEEEEEVTTSTHTCKSYAQCVSLPAIMPEDIKRALLQVKNYAEVQKRCEVSFNRARAQQNNSSTTAHKSTSAQAQHMHVHTHTHTRRSWGTWACTAGS